MKRYSAVVLVALGLIFAAQPVRSIERSGEVIRELMNSIDDEMTSMEKQGEILAKSRNSLLKVLEKNFRAFKGEGDSGKRQLLAADMQLTMAKLNAQETKEVQIYLNTLHGLIPKIERLKKEMAGGRAFGGGPTFARYQAKMGSFMTQTVSILDGLKLGATEALKQEISGLEALLVSSYLTLTPDHSRAKSSAQQLRDIQNDLENAFLQLVNIRKLLAQERRELQVTSELVMARLVLERLERGPLSNGRFSDKSGDIKEGLKKRWHIRQNIHKDASRGADRRGENASGGSPDKQILDRIRSGDYGWKRR